MRYAIIKDDVVISTVVWDGESKWTPGEGCRAVRADEMPVGDSSDGAAFVSPPPSAETVKAECSRRICAAFSPAAQANMHGYITLMVIGTVPSSEADTDLYSRAVTWINTMRRRSSELVGNPAYADDKSWPDLGPDLTAFAARF